MSRIEELEEEVRKLKEKVADLEEMVDYLDERCQAYAEFLEEQGFKEEFDELYGDAE